MESDDRARKVTPARLKTGIPGLDVLLDGGLIAGGIYLVTGRPGTGKTTLGNQLAFHHATTGEHAVYVTLLAESHARLIANLQSMTFFRPEALNRSLFYLGAYSALRERQLAGLLELLRGVLREQKPTLLVIDGFAVAQPYAETVAALREFVSELQALAGMTLCTTVLLSNFTAEFAHSPEHSTVDGMIEMSLQRASNRTLRTIEVVKFRGSRHLLGQHELEITSAGIVVRPRTEEILTRDTKPSLYDARRLSTGLAHLDAMLGGGLLGGTTTMLLGFAGSGKTTLGVHFLAAGCASREPSLYFGFYESPDRLVAGAENLGLSMREAVGQGTLGVIWQQPLHYHLDALADRLLDDVARRGVRRLFIDGLDGFRQASAFPERTMRFLTALVNELRARGVTTIISEETQKLFGPEVEVRIEGVSALVENIILTEYLAVGSTLHRLLSVVKQRASNYDPSIRELYITEHGLALAADSKTADRILAQGSEALMSQRNRRPSRAQKHTTSARAKKLHTPRGRKR